MSGTARFLRDSCSFSLIVVEQSAEQLVTVDGSDFSRDRRRWGLACLIQRHIAERLMWPVCIVELRV